MKQHWYAAETYSGAEWQVHDALKQADMVSWLAYEIKSVGGGRWRHGKVRALIEGYVFIKTDRKSLRSVKTTVGVKNIVFCGDTPAIIPDPVMEDLMARLSETLVTVATEKPPLEFGIGDQRKVRIGPFEGLIVEIARIVSFEKVEVWMEAMGQKVRLAVKPDHLGAIRAQEHCGSGSV